MASVTFELRDPSGIGRKLAKDLTPHLQAGLMAVGAEVQDRLAPYPPTSIANSPSQGRWYERGKGGFRRRKRDGAVIQTSSSETLGRRWALRPRGRLTVVLTNSASYAAFVHNKKRQARFHRERGWKTDEDVMAEIRRDGTADRLLRRAVEKGLGLR